MRVCLDDLIEQPRLVSGNVGWKSHPVTLSANLHEGRFEADLEVDVAYSSTCPCSAALARELIRERFLDAFGHRKVLRAEDAALWLSSEEGISATTHSQRSHGDVRVRLAAVDDATPFAWLVALVERAVGTPVQTAVKREDEQAFADLNGSNLMFCEDAARRIRAVLEHDGRVSDSGSPYATRRASTPTATASWGWRGCPEVSRPSYAGGP